MARHPDRQFAEIYIRGTFFNPIDAIGTTEIVLGAYS